MNTTTPIAAASDREAEVRAAIEEAFVTGPDGWYYPTGQPIPLVRIALAEGQYRVMRRRKPHTAWMPVACADVAEFSYRSFRVWLEHWV